MNNSTNSSPANFSEMFHEACDTLKRCLDNKNCSEDEIQVVAESVCGKLFGKLHAVSIEDKKLLGFLLLRLITSDVFYFHPFIQGCALFCDLLRDSDDVINWLFTDTDFHALIIKMGQSIYVFGDYDCQTRLLEIMHRLCGERHGQFWAKLWFHDEDTKEKFNAIDVDKFEVECRYFINHINSSPHSKGVYSFQAISASLNPIELVKPPEIEMWVDLNYATKCLSFCCTDPFFEKKRYVKYANWETVSVKYTMVELCYVLENAELGVQELSLMLNRSYLRYMNTENISFNEDEGRVIKIIFSSVYNISLHLGSIFGSAFQRMDLGSSQENSQSSSQGTSSQPGRMARKASYAVVKYESEENSAPLFNESIKLTVERDKMALLQKHEGYESEETVEKITEAINNSIKEQDSMIVQPAESIASSSASNNPLITKADNEVDVEKASITSSSSSYKIDIIDVKEKETAVWDGPSNPEVNVMCSDVAMSAKSSQSPPQQFKFFKSKSISPPENVKVTPLRNADNGSASKKRLRPPRNISNTPQESQSNTMIQDNSFLISPALATTQAQPKVDLKSEKVKSTRSLKPLKKSYPSQDGSVRRISRRTTKSDYQVVSSTPKSQPRRRRTKNVHDNFYEPDRHPPKTEDHNIEDILADFEKSIEEDDIATITLQKSSISTIRNGKRSEINIDSMGDVSLTSNMSHDIKLEPVEKTPVLPKNDLPVNKINIKEKIALISDTEPSEASEKENTKVALKKNENHSETNIEVSNKEVIEIEQLEVSNTEVLEIEELEVLNTEVPEIEELESVNKEKYTAPLPQNKPKKKSKGFRLFKFESEPMLINLEEPKRTPSKTVVSKGTISKETEVKKTGASNRKTSLGISKSPIIHDVTKQMCTTLADSGYVTTSTKKTPTTSNDDQAKEKSFDESLEIVKVEVDDSTPVMKSKRSSALNSMQKTRTMLSSSGNRKRKNKIILDESDDFLPPTITDLASTSSDPSWFNRKNAPATWFETPPKSYSSVKHANSYRKRKTPTRRVSKRKSKIVTPKANDSEKSPPDWSSIEKFPLVIERKVTNFVASSTSTYSKNENEKDSPFSVPRPPPKAKQPKEDNSVNSDIIFPSVSSDSIPENRGRKSDAPLVSSSPIETFQPPVQVKRSFGDSLHKSVIQSNQDATSAIKKRKRKLDDVGSADILNLSFGKAEHMKKFLDDTSQSPMDDQVDGCSVDSVVGSSLPASTANDSLESTSRARRSSPLPFIKSEKIECNAVPSHLSSNTRSRKSRKMSPLEESISPLTSSLEHVKDEKVRDISFKPTTRQVRGLDSIKRRLRTTTGDKKIASAKSYSFKNQLKKLNAVVTQILSEHDAELSNSSNSFVGEDMDKHEESLISSEFFAYMDDIILKFISTLQKYLDEMHTKLRPIRRDLFYSVLQEESKRKGTPKAGSTQKYRNIKEKLEACMDAEKEMNKSIQELTNLVCKEIEKECQGAQQKALKQQEELVLKELKSKFDELLQTFWKYGKFYH